LVEEKNDVGAFKDFSGDSKSTSSTGSTGSTSSTSSTPASEPTKQVSSTQSSGDRLFASPLARKTARENEISLEGLKGSGPRGRIIQADVLEAKEKGVKEIKTPQVQPESLQTQKVSTPQPSHVDYEDLEISGIRQVTAERLTYSKTQIPHFYLNMEINVDKISALRTELNKHSPVKLSFNDLIIKAASLACIKVPETNSSWQGSFIRRYKNVDMSVAVQTDHGLMTPIITNTNLKGLAQISKEMKDLAERAKERKLKPQEFQGGTFTISNMGMMGISSFSAVINPPQACILAVGKSEKKVLYDENAKDKNAPYK
jgi:pyruvate dehydrogenase E2 component (dihydrolipoamide acetyltransferase)